MGKSLFIAEKPSVANEFAKALKDNFTKRDGYLESETSVVTWCVGHLVTMSYPEVYDAALKKWSLDTIPFLPDEFKYEVIPDVSKQFNIVRGLLNRPDVTRIYVCTDSGREGEYIYRLVDTMAQVPDTKDKRRVWIDSQTEEEVLRGIREAKPLSEYDNLSDAAYLRAKEDYLMGINFSRVLTLKYGYNVRSFLGETKGGAISVGRVMTCVLGMVVRREREIRSFVKTPFYRVLAGVDLAGHSKSTSTAGTDADHLNADTAATAAQPLDNRPDSNMTESVGTGNGSDESTVKNQGNGSDGSTVKNQGNGSDESTAENQGNGSDGKVYLSCEFKAVEGSKYYNTPYMYKENGFKELETAKQMIGEVSGKNPEDIIYENQYGKTSAKTSDGQNAQESNAQISGYRASDFDNLTGEVLNVEKKKETKNPPLLFNLAEAQNECSKLFKISPDETLNIIQELYEKKLVTYPRTDARVLSTAVAKEIHKNIAGLKNFEKMRPFAEEALELGTYKNIAKTKYVNDKQITDHYAIIPTGQGFGNLNQLKPLSAKVYELICRRFLSIFYPAAIYRKVTLTVGIGDEKFFANFKALENEGWLKVSNVNRDRTNQDRNLNEGKDGERDEGADGDTPEQELGKDMLEIISGIRKGTKLGVDDFVIRMGETAPPKRYNSGSMILAMENAGQLIEDEDLRAQIKGSGIGTSATRAEILNKLVRIAYLNLNKKTQIITPTLKGEVVYEVVNATIKGLLNPELTASWEKGLTQVAEGSIREAEYMQKLTTYISKMTNGVKGLDNRRLLEHNFKVAQKYYKL